MCDDFTCEECEQDVEFMDLGLLASPSDMCSEFSVMLTLCRGCRDVKLEDELSSHLNKSNISLDYALDSLEGHDFIEEIMRNKNRYDITPDSVLDLLMQSKLERP